MFDPIETPKRLEAFLANQDPAMAKVTIADYRPITGGYSKQMASFTAEVGPRTTRFVARANLPPGLAMLESDIGYEWEVLRALTEAGNVPIPAARWFDHDGSCLGTKAIIVDYQAGATLVRALADSASSNRERLADQLCHTAAAIHAVDITSLPPIVARPADWSSSLEQRLGQFETHERAYLQSDPLVRYLGAWLDAHRPPPVPLSLVHGDFQATNIIVDGARSFSVVDWELAHIGDPREDLGRFKLGAFFTPPDLIGLDDERFCARYRELTGLTEEQVNPATLAYFAILGSIEWIGMMFRLSGAYARGETDGLPIAFGSILFSVLHQVWMGFLSDAGKGLATTDSTGPRS